MGRSGASSSAPGDGTDCSDESSSEAPRPTKKRKHKVCAECDEHLLPSRHGAVALSLEPRDTEPRGPPPGTPHTTDPSTMMGQPGSLLRFLIDSGRLVVPGVPCTPSGTAAPSDADIVHATRAAAPMSPMPMQWSSDSVSEPWFDEQWDDETDGCTRVDPREADPVYDDNDDMGSDSHGTSSCGSPARASPHYPFAREPDTDVGTEHGAPGGDAGCAVDNATAHESLDDGATDSENLEDLLEQSESDA